MNYYRQQLESVAIDVGVDKELPQSEFITAKKVIEKFNELQYKLDAIKDAVETLQSCTPSVANEVDLQLILDIINGFGGVLAAEGY